MGESRKDASAFAKATADKRCWMLDSRYEVTVMNNEFGWRELRNEFGWRELRYLLFDNQM
jgi:hypothetical protein